MRILMVCTNFRVFGAEMMSLHILKAFHERGHEQLAVTSIWSDGEFSRRLELLGIPEVELPLGPLTKKIWWTVKTLARLPKLSIQAHRTFKRFRPDVVLLTSPKQGLFLYHWLGRQPSLLIEHSMKENSSANRWMYRALDGKLAGFISVSQFMAAHLQELGIKPHRIRVIYNCSETETAPTPSEEWSSRRTENSLLRIGIAGQISPHKGHDRLLDAVLLLKGRGAKFEVRVFGNGDPAYVQHLQARIADAQLGAIWRWMDYVSDPQSIYGNMDVCVVPSCFDEPFGMVALEAASFGIPVIASRRGGLPEIVVDGVTGWLVDSDSPEQIAGRIEWLITNPDQARAMGVAGREHVLSHFTPERMVDDFADLFHTCVRSQIDGESIRNEGLAAHVK